MSAKREVGNGVHASGRGEGATFVSKWQRMWHKHKIPAGLTVSPACQAGPARGGSCQAHVNGWSLVGSQGAWLNEAGTEQGGVKAGSDPRLPARRAHDSRQEDCGQGPDLRGNNSGNSRVRHCARRFSNTLSLRCDSDRDRVRVGGGKCHLSKQIQCPCDFNFKNEEITLEKKMSSIGSESQQVVWESMRGARLPSLGSGFTFPAFQVSCA